MSKIIGIDISKQTFDVSFLKKDKWEHKIFKNNLKGFDCFKNLIEENDWIVMEASGPYYVQLASYLNAFGYKVCVLNPLIIRRYSQTRLYRAKTDKKDARTIAEYGTQYDLKKWSPESKSSTEIKQLYTALELLKKQIHQTKRQLASFQATGLLTSSLKRELKQVEILLQRRIDKFEKEIEKIGVTAYKETIERLKTIPGVGIKTAIMMSVITDNFTKFESHKQLTAFVGFSPRLYQSGTSVKGKGHICKMGKPQIRKLLYLCSWSAKKVNKHCIEMYKRLKAKGKPERVIKIALANKLIKQIFSIAKNKKYYDENHQNLYCCN
ncbi:IS110 family transposase [Polaribacter sp. MSW13]|uniref:IS110 family transposase n=1 Tax=Polaribacter marinus TaxID=2916838 RepID=A0A9X2AK53_9FLAO|nr:IS110 family transposase [Polaribacter marinus]MCI2230156.1 IS110 family transposase [Polaribacter marinus]